MFSVQEEGLLFPRKVTSGRGLHNLSLPFPAYLVIGKHRCGAHTYRGIRVDGECQVVNERCFIPHRSIC